MTSPKSKREALKFQNSFHGSNIQYMDKIEKAFRRLSSEERRYIKDILRSLSAGNYKDLDIKKLKGREDIFRVRKGDLRIIYRVTDGGIFILAIERRREKTYRKF